MLTHRRRPMVEGERFFFLPRIRPGLLTQLVRRLRGRDIGAPEAVMDEYDVEVESCVIWLTRTEEHTVYFLDTGDGHIFILFCQTIYQFDVEIDEDERFAELDADDVFYLKRFTLQGHAESGIVFKIVVHEQELLPVRRLTEWIQFKRMHQFEVISGTSATLLDDLRRAGLAE
jgi:hypothetical protein